MIIQPQGDPVKEWVVIQNSDLHHELLAQVTPETIRKIARERNDAGCDRED